jgi:AcrR family transcriptional regulator
MAKTDRYSDIPARDRLLEAAYELFCARGIRAVGIDAILERAGCAKASLYSNFTSKVDLAVSILDRRERKWTREWLQAEIMRRGATPEERLLAIFDTFDGWFRRDDFEGCLFINVLLESEPGSAVRDAATAHLARIRAMVAGQAGAAGLQNPAEFAGVWHMLMKGSIVAAVEGHVDAARDARTAAELILKGWPRR